MKRSITIALVMIVGVLACGAQNRWNVYAGGSLSHLCEKPWIHSDKTYGWGGGAFIGGGYEINFDAHWSLTPHIEISYNDNGATLSSEEQGFYPNHSEWLGTWSVNVPVTVGFRVSVSEKVRLRFGAGPYMQEALSGRRYKRDSDEKEPLSGNMWERFNVGVIGETAVETGPHFSYMLRAQYPFLKEGWVRKTVVLSIGVKYSF